MRGTFLITALTTSLVLTGFPCYTQNQPVTPQSAAKFLRVKEERGFSDNNNYNSVDYADITGIPFWKGKYLNATLFKEDSVVGTKPVKINLFTSEVYCLEGNREFVLSDNGINKIVFVTLKDTTTFVRSVPNLFINNKKTDGFVQILNNGNYQLLKYIKKELLTADSALVFKRHYFKETYYYFIRKDQKVEQIKRLDKENVLIKLPLSGRLKEWMETNQINFKNEKDLILLLNHYNLKVANN
jgi:hypothetical protein